MYWHLILTEKCNSECKYCYEKSLKEFDNGLQEKFEFDFNIPCESKINIKKLKNFLKQDKNPVLIFYGGEPLLNISKIIKIINSLGKGVKYCMQTNGKLLDKLPKKYMNQFSKILISIDGDKERTDFNRGKATYEKVIQNIKLIGKNGFKGELVARMTISQEFPDLYQQVKNILKLNLFDSIHWQIDAGFYKNDFNKKGFSRFVEKYNQSLTKLAGFWINNIKKGNVLKIYPFLGIYDRLTQGGTGLQCGAGDKGYAITTNGIITACPIMNNIKNFYAGDLNSNLNQLKKFKIIEPCESCKYLQVCGGRCLYSNYAKLWPKQGKDLICKTIRHLIHEIQKHLPEIKNCLNKKIIKKQDFEFEKYFGPEIIP